MPVFNEEATLEHAARGVLDADYPCERSLVLIDDGSTDRSWQIMQTLAEDDRVHCLRHERNSGKGSAIRTGLARARDVDADIVLIHDADLEYDPQDHAQVLAPILAERADAVIGSRFIGQSHRVLYYWHAVANRFITTCSNALTNLNLTDIECCTKAMTRPVYSRLDLREKRFGVEPEIVARLARMRLDSDGTRRPLRVYEVGVRYAGRTYAEGKKITWRDGISALRCILRYNLLP